MLLRKYNSTLLTVMVVLTVVPLFGLASNTTAMDLTDAEISQAIETEMIVEPGVQSHRIDILTTDGIVTLEGSVDSLLAKERAEKIAGTVKGVRGVVNRIAVNTTPRPDSEIEEEVREALLMNPATESFEIDVDVEDSELTLKGKVDSWQENQLAEKVALSIQGIESLDNQIEVDYQDERSDLDIQGDINETLRWDTRVDHALINVDVENGRVDLNGTVGSYAERQQAIADAWVRGVSEVDAEDLQVQDWARDEKYRKDKYVDVTDRQVKQAVQDSFLYDPRVHSFTPDVTVENGVVTLTGEVDSLQAKRAAEEDAENVVGVFRVKNYLKVRPTELLSDSKIQNRVETKLETDPYLGRYEVSVSSHNGTVYLWGDVEDTFERARAARLAAQVPGVIAIQNNLAVDLSDEVDLAAQKTDWEILEDINDELFWSPFVDSEEVIVTVDDGIATLEGTVDTWSEREAAEENAFEGGAAVVDNDLKVKSGPDYYQPM